MSTLPNDFREMRAAIVEDLQTKLFGPLDPMDTNSIRLNPLQRKRCAAPTLTA